jgi:DNA-binding transcriptional LysR family regulator
VFGRDWRFFDLAGNPTTVRVSGNLVTTSIPMARTAAVAGIGLYLCAPFIASDLLASGALIPILLDYPTPEMEIVALYPHRRHLTAKVRAFVDILVDVLTAEQQRWSDLSVALIDQPVEN